MKTNISIELNDEQRNILSNILTKKQTKKLATRKDVNMIAKLMFGSLLSQDKSNDGCEFCKVIDDLPWTVIHKDEVMEVYGWEEDGKKGIEIWKQERRAS